VRALRRGTRLAVESSALGVASWRLTRLVVEDGIWAPTRERLLSALWATATQDGPRWRVFLAGKLYELLTCPWCVGVWAALVIVCVWRRKWPWQLRHDTWVLVAATAGANGLIVAGVAASE